MFVIQRKNDRDLRIDAKEFEFNDEKVIFYNRKNEKVAILLESDVVIIAKQSKIDNFSVEESIKDFNLDETLEDFGNGV